MKSHIPTVNTPAHIHVLEEHEKKYNNVPRLKRGRPIGLKDVAPHKRREKLKLNTFTFRANYKWNNLRRG